MKTRCLILLGLVGLMFNGNFSSAALVAYWDFDTDFSADSSAYDATSVNGAVITTEGKIGGAAKFDRAKQQYLTAASPFTTGSYTYVAWYFLDVADMTGTNRYFVLESSNAAKTNYPASYGLRDISGVDSGNVFTWTSSTTSSNFSFNAQGNQVWHHIAVTYDASSGQFNAYLDGTLANSMIAGGTLGATTNLVIGGHRAGTSRNFNGLIDEVAVFDNVLTADYIRYLAAGNAVPEPTTLIMLGLGGLTLLKKRKKG